MATERIRFFKRPEEFRAWLERFGTSRTELLVGFYKVGSGRPSLSWSESVDEALCLGWIDGVRTRIDDQSYTIRFSPRKPTSIWSAINIRKMEALQAAGRMTAAGLERFARRTTQKSRIYAYEQATHAELGPEQVAEFRKFPAAWAYFSAQPTSYRHRMAWRVLSAKRAETRQARLAQLIEASANKTRI